MESSLVSVKGLSHRFDERWVLRDIDLEVKTGEILAIMGSSGGGKTTLLRCISGLITPTEGQVTVDGVNVQQDPEEARLRMGMVFQMAALFDYMDVQDNVMFGVKRMLKSHPDDHPAFVQNALDRVGLQGIERQMPAELSGGMRKRVGIARAIALDPKLMLYDEPTTGLDPITTYTIDKLIVDLRRELAVTSLVVSHDVNSVVRTADRVTFLHEGRLVFIGTPDAFLADDHPAIKELVTKARSTCLQ